MYVKYKNMQLILELRINILRVHLKINYYTFITF